MAFKNSRGFHLFKKRYFFILILAFSMLTPYFIFGQSSNPPIFPFGGDGPTQETPIGGLVLLAVGGGAYAIKKLRDQNRE